MRKPRRGRRCVVQRGQDDATNDAELQELRSKLPQDTRDVSARLLGDPLPGRSALDAKMKENG